jgi:xylulokinase
LEAEAGDRIFDITLQPVNPLFTLPQLIWMVENRPHVWEEVDRIRLPKDYVRARLVSGDNFTDSYDATGTQLFDPRRRRWSAELLEMIGWTPKQMPNVRDAANVAGELEPGVAEAIGLRPGTPVVIGSGDSVLEALAVGVVEAGDSLVKLASSGTVIAVSRDPLPSRSIQTYPHVISGRWIGLAGTNSGAETLRWLTEELLGGGRGASLDHVLQRAAEAPPGSEGLLFHPYLSGGRSPQWNPEMRGQYTGISERHGSSHLARATMEGVVFALLHAAEAADRAGHRRETIRLIGGGAASDLWAQIVADVFGSPVERVPGSAPARGAALLAGIGIGVLSQGGLEDLHLQSVDRFVPDLYRGEVYAAAYQEFRTRAEELDRRHRDSR